MSDSDGGSASPAAENTTSTTTDTVSTAQDTSPAQDTSATQSTAAVQDSSGNEPSTETSQTEGTTNVSRSADVLRAHGWSDTDIADLGPAADKVAGRYEAELESSSKAIFDARKASESKQPDAKAEPKPDAQAQAQAPSDYKPFLDKIAQNYDPELAESIDGMLKHQHAAFERQLSERDQRFGRVDSWVQAETQRREAEGINGFFGKVDKNYHAKYGADGTKATSEQLKARQAVVDLAYGLHADAQKRGVNLSGERALAQAHLALTKETRRDQAVQAVQQQVVKRAKQTSIPPGTSGSGTGSRSNDPDANWRELAKADIVAKQEAYRNRG